MHGYRSTEMGADQTALVTTPEKALCDLVYLHLVGDLLDYLRELRLQNLNRLSLDELHRQATLTNRPKLHRTATIVSELAQAEAQEYEVL